ncbi:MAG TPA: DUF5654 family protein [Ktedonobacterales bacterium]
MSDEQQQEAERRRRFSMPQVPQGMDPRKVMDAAAVERLMKAQAVARAEAQAATTVVIATIVSLVTSAFSFIAALAWNNAIQSLLSGLTQGNKLGPFTLNTTEVQFVYALIVTIIAIIVILIVNRFAGDLAKKSAIAAASK